MITEIILHDLPKLSLNSIYSGIHWAKRKKHKDNYYKIIKSQFNNVFTKDNFYSVDYEFNFSKKPLDVSNTVFMLKMIEDVIFEDDTYRVVKELNIKSKKAKIDFVKITVKQL